MASKVKHSKYKNTGLIFEFLVRQVTADILSKVSTSKSLQLIKSRFNESTELGKEIFLYSVLVNKKFNSDKKADYFIYEALKQRKKLNESRLKREKYNLIKSIKENYNVNHFFSSKVPEYKVYASIYKLFEHPKKLSPEEKTETYFNILEHVTTKSKNSIKLNNLNEELNNDEDLRILTYRSLLERFNKKYSKLNGKQRELLRNYINNVSNSNSLKEYVEKKIPFIKKELKKYIPTITDKVVKIKLKEAINSIDNFCNAGKSNIVKDNVVVQLMRYYELLKELKNFKNRNKKNL